MRTGQKAAPVSDLIRCGQMVGMAYQINVAELEKYLENHPKDFFYVKECKAVLEFAKAVQFRHEAPNQ
jgi:hypothetical protein